MPPHNDKESLSELKYFMHDFANAGTGHKFSELLTGLYFAKKNHLQYVFNEKSFVHNFRQADLQWLGDLIRQRYPAPPEWGGFNDQVFDMSWKQWIPVYHYRGTTAHAYDQRNELELQEPLIGYGGRNSYVCPGDNPRPDSDCFFAEFSFFSATRDLQDLLLTSRELPGQQRSKVEQVERLAIHIRLGDITVSEPPETYLRVIQGMRRQLSISLPDDQVHFIYFQHPTWWGGDNRRLEDLK